MRAEIKVPSVGESISEATIGEWKKKSGEFVKRDEVILLLETDKASVEVVAPNDGVIALMAKAGETVKIGAVVAAIDTEGVATAGMPQPLKNVEPKAQTAVAGTSAPSLGKEIHPDLKGHLSPAVRRVAEETGASLAGVVGTGKDGRLLKSDVEASIQRPAPPPTTAVQPVPKSAETTSVALRSSATKEGGIRRVPMTTIRKRIAERLVQSQQTAAILTTFNEVDMSALNGIRERYKEKFKEKYGTGLGFMGFFVKACVEALIEVPQVNAFIEGTDVVYHDYCNVGVAVGTEKGLIVPVLRNAHQMSVPQIEMEIKRFAQKAREGKITVDDLAGGTFTISNGGVYGSLMSTPIINPPQSAILGMHKIEDRPVVVNKEVVVRPMMYLALSYDHRLIDGKEAVTFLVRLKEYIEDPGRLLVGV